jgi:hypothetical protein
MPQFDQPMQTNGAQQLISGFVASLLAHETD